MFWSDPNSYKIKNIRGDQEVRVWDQDVCSFMVSDSSPVVAHMMTTGDLHGR